MSVEEQKRSKSPLGRLDGNYSDNFDYRDLIRKRGNIRGRITLFGKYVDSLNKSLISDQQLVELGLRTSNSEQIFKEFQDMQCKIENIISETELSQQLEIRESIESQYYEIVSLAKCIIKKYEEKFVSKSCSHNSNNVIKLPTIALPSFDGSFENWLEYRDTFISLIHEANEINTIQKFHYLRSSLKGGALQVIKSLEFSADNYQVAWDLLTNRYDNNRLLINNHVKSLFTLQTITKESPSQIRKLIDSVLKHLRALKTMEEPTEHWDTLVIYLIVTKLDSNTCKEWENRKSLVCKHSKVTLNDLLQFLKDRSDILDMVQGQNHKYSSELIKKPIVNTPQSSSQIRSFISHKQTALNAQNNAVKSFRNVKCIMCEGSHSLYACSNFLNLSVDDRLKFVSNKNLCANCLRTGHSVDECSYRSCKLCSQRHNSLIHKSVSCISLQSARPVTHINVSDAMTNDLCANASSLLTHSYHSKQAVHSIELEQVLLSTAIVEVCNDNITTVARVLLDSGSQRCFITDTLCKKLRLSTIQSTFNITGIGNSVLRSEQSCNLLIRSKTSDFSTRLNCSVLPKITYNLPNTHIDVRSLHIPKNVTLADPNFYVPSDIDILIGADVFWSLLQEGRMRLSNGPYLQNTHLGWIISGAFSVNNYNPSCRLHTNNRVCFAFSTTSLDDQLKRFWELEEVDNKKSTSNIFTADEMVCEDLGENAVTRIS